MRRRMLMRRQWWLAALAGAGVAATHALAYRVTQSDPHLRGELLHDTGHDLWPSFVSVVALAAMVAGLAGGVTRQVAGGFPCTRTMAARLALLQGAAWLLVECLERAISGHGHVSAHTLTPVAIGLVVQVAVAIAGAVVLSLLARAVAAWQARRRPRWSHGPVLPRPSWSAVAVPRVATNPAAPRAPPAR